MKSRLDSIAALNTAARDYRKAALRLKEVTSAVFPVGSSVLVTLGRSRVRGTVLRAGGFAWYDPDNVQIKNDATGKLRNFAASGSDVVML